MATSKDEAMRRFQAFSHGVQPVSLTTEPDDWCRFSLDWLKSQDIPGPIAMLVAGPSARSPLANYRLEFLRVGAG